MCQAIPRKIVQLDGTRAQVDYAGRPTWVEAAGVPDLQVGDYIVVYAGQALERMDDGEAEALLAWYTSLESLLEDAEAAR